MLFLTCLAFGFGAVLGLLRGGRLERLARLPLRLVGAAMAGWLIQVALFVSILGPALDPWAATLHLTSVALIGIVVVANWAVPGFPIIGLGLLLNAAVYLANGGFMPVSEAALAAAGNPASAALLEGGRVQKTFLMQAETPLWFIGDVLPFALVGKVYSPGDLVAAIGVFVLTVAGMARHAKVAASQPFCST